MKVLKYIGIVLLALVIILGVLTFVLPTSMKVEESISIDAPKSVVKDQILYFEKSQEWSPWSQIDPDMNTWLEGEDGKVGTKYFWKGNDDAGEGVQEIVAVEENQVDLKITFIKPFESEADTYFKIDENSDKVNVTWGFTSEMKRPFNLMSLFFDMEESIGKDYQKGLESLKDISESIAENYANGYKIEKVDFEPQYYLFKREKVSFENMQSFYKENLGEMDNYVTASEDLKSVGYASGMYFDRSEEEQTTDMAATVPFSPKDKNVDLNSLEFETKELSGEAYKLKFYGDYEKLGDAHDAIHQYLENNNIEMSEVVLEEYVTDPANEPNPDKWLTNIYYFKK